MDRLTNRTSDRKGSNPYDYWLKNCEHDMDIWKTIEKLAHYEDLEDNGNLFITPCKVGDDAYVIDKDFSGNLTVYKGIWDVVSIRILKDNNIEVHGQVSYDIPDPFYDNKKMMQHCMYVGQYDTKFGKVVFLTENDAKRKLEEIKKC